VGVVVVVGVAGLVDDRGGSCRWVWKYPCKMCRESVGTTTEVSFETKGKRRRKYDSRFAVRHGARGVGGGTGLRGSDCGVGGGGLVHEVVEVML
jgi:hypothetical protein